MASLMSCRNAIAADAEAPTLRSAIFAHTRSMISH